MESQKHQESASYAANIQKDMARIEKNLAQYQASAHIANMQADISRIQKNLSQVKEQVDNKIGQVESNTRQVKTMTMTITKSATEPPKTSFKIKIEKHENSYSMVMSSGNMTMTSNNISGDEEMKFIPDTEMFLFRNGLRNAQSMTVNNYSDHTVIHAQPYVITFWPGHSPQVHDNRTQSLVQLKTIKVQDYYEQNRV